MLRVVIIGYGEMFTNLIAGTLDANCEIVGVYRKDTISYNPFLRRIRDTFNPSVEYSYIKSYNLPEIITKWKWFKPKYNGVNSEDFRQKLLKLNPDIILVGSWGEKLSKDIYNLPKIASINAHPSLLPKYRGPNPYFWAIRNMEHTSGISFHLIDEGYDTGSILAQEEIKIFPSDTGKSLKERTVLTARGVVCELLNALREDIIIPLKQQEEKASYYSQPDELCLDFSKSADENSALIRGIYPWGEAYFYHNENCFAVSHSGMEICENKTQYKSVGTIVSKNSENSTISVLCGDNKVLKIKISHYKLYDRPFTGNYIKREFIVGENLL